MARTLIAALLALAAVLPQGFAFASSGGCGQFFAHRQTYAYAAPVVAYAPAVYYAAGRDIEAEALAEKVAKLVLGKLEARLTQPQRAAATAASPLVEHCAKCHSGAAPKGGVVIDGSTPLLCGQITESLRQIASDEMPKDHKLSPEQKGAVMQALLNLEAREPEQVTVPKPESTGVLK